MKLIDILKGIIRDPFDGTIYEGLIQTVDIEKATDIIKKQFGNIKGADIVNSNNEIKIGFEPSYVDPKLERYSYGIKDPNISKIIQLTNNLGYFPSIVKYEKFDNTFITQKFNNKLFREYLDENKPEFLVMIFEKKYDEKIDPPKFIYHITNEKFIPNIRKIGFKPKTLNKNSSHPDRIYFSINKDSSEQLWDNLKLYYEKNKGVLVTINTSKLKDVSFYNDPNFNKKGIYTYNNIPPESIITIEPIKEI